MAANNDSQKQLLTLIRDVATEKSQGERRVVSLKKRIEELRSELETVNEELEQEKRHKESYEQDTKGYEVESSMNDASIQSLEARNSLIQDEISKVGSHAEALKNEEGALRDAFIGKMVELNATIRRFQESIKGSTEESCMDTSSADELLNEKDIEADLSNLRNELTDILAQTTRTEQELAAEQNIHEQLQKELLDLDKNVSAMAAFAKDTEELRELARQTSELEEKYTVLGEELQKSSICPKCNRNNGEALGGSSQES